MTSPGRLRLWMRWSWRDLRRRWLLVAAIALVVSIGTGAYAAFTSTSTWREESNDASFALLNMHDLRVELPAGSFVPAGSLRDAVAGLEHAGMVAESRERLIVPTQVEIPSDDRTVLVRGELVGVAVGDGEPRVNGIHVEEGRGLEPADAGEPVAVLELSFVDHNDLPPQGTLRVAGDVAVGYVGVGMSPEYFLVTGAEGTPFAFGDYAVLFVPLETAQSIGRHPGSVNDLVLTLAPGADRHAVRLELEASLAEHLPLLGAFITTRDDDDSYRFLYDDIETDQQFFNVIAFLILAGAAIAAFNLASRMVDAQRREIGVGMALGAPPRMLALRPALFGVQVAIFGAIGGIGVGLVLGQAMRSLFTSVLPLPVWKTDFQGLIFLRAAAIAFVIPLAATLLPVRRALRVEPMTAMRTAHLAAKTGRLVDVGRRLRLPGRSFAQMPVRNLLRTPRRTLLTALGIGAAITTLVAVLGLLDSFFGVIDRTEAEATRGPPGRTLVVLDRFYPEDAPEVAAVAAAGVVDRAQPGVRIFGAAIHNEQEVDLLVGVLDVDGAMWTPTVTAGDLRGEGILLSEKAADDLGVRPGDEVALRHPVQVEPGVFSFAVSSLRVAGLHPDPIRAVAYMDAPSAGPFGLDGWTNLVQVTPAPGVDEDGLKRGLFGMSGVASVQPVAELTRGLRDSLDDFLGFLQIAQGLVLVLALLIAFNSTSISVDERAREHATMFAFGVRIRRVLGMTTAESVATGLIGTAIGIGSGYMVLRWMVGAVLPRTLPDLALVASVTPSTALTALGLGVFAVALAPLFALRKLLRMDVPSTLRVLE